MQRWFLERDLEALKTNRFVGNRDFSERVGQVLWTAGCTYWDFHTGKLSKVSGGARSDWGAKLVAQMFSFLETVRLQRGDALAQLCELLSLAGRSLPGLHTN